MLLNNPLETGLTQTQRTEKGIFQQWLEAVYSWHTNWISNLVIKVRLLSLEKIPSNRLPCECFWISSKDSDDKRFTQISSSNLPLCIFNFMYLRRDTWLSQMKNIYFPFSWWKNTGYIWNLRVYFISLFPLRRN